ncbi:MAG: TIGR01906 family membrane protein [Anaerolineales bacterium]
MPPLLKSALSWIVTLLTPLAILMFGVRLLLTPAFLPVEYHMPGFPADTYGFSVDDRIRWATPTLVYLINDQGIDYLGALTFDPSTSSPSGDSAGGASIYNPRELAHMQDVKNVLQKLLEVWDVTMIALIALGFWAWRSGWLETYRAGWRRGGFLMIALLAAFGVFAVTSFWDFFSWFHSLFFQGTSWQFAYSDTLIRLFPMRFWEDCFIYIGAFALLVGLTLAFGLKPKPQ